MNHPEPGESVQHEIDVPRLFKPAVAVHPGASSRRIQSLRAWLDSQIELKQTAVSLPGSDLELAIHHPTAASRAKLFEQAKASRDRQLPFWADIWPSGIALGSIALDHADELAGKQVLEIGSGLGTTAAAALSAGATVLAVDYTSLALGLCRYNALHNVGISPRTLPVNWRHLTRRALSCLEAAGPFPIIMAADVLYESRDIDPLVNLIDRLLAPDGQLWLSEPERKVAARFLNTLATRGWRFTTRASDGPWPPGLSGRVNIHFMRRELYSDHPYSTVGGWRV